MLPSESSCLESLALRNDKGKPAVYDLQSSQWEVEHLCVGGCWLDASVALKSTYSGPFGVASHGFSHLTLDSGFCLPFLSPLLHPKSFLIQFRGWEKKDCGNVLYLGLFV